MLINNYIENCRFKYSSNGIRLIRRLLPLHKTYGQLSLLVISLILFTPILKYSAASSTVRRGFSLIDKFSFMALSSISNKNAPRTRQIAFQGHLVNQLGLVSSNPLQSQIRTILSLIRSRVLLSRLFLGLNRACDLQSVSLGTVLIDVV